MPRVTIVVDGDDVYVDGFTWSGNMVDTQGGQQLNPIHSLLEGGRPEGLTLTTERISARWEAMEAILGTDQHDPSLPATGGATVTVIPRSE